MKLPRLQLALILILALVASLAQTAPVRAEGAQRVVILPFTTNAQEDISFLARGIRDMLASRLAWQGKVAVVESDLVNQELAKVKAPINVAKAKQIANALRADVAVFGSITKLGETLSVDGKVVKASEDAPALSTYMQAANINEVIPKINGFAQQVNAEIFKRPEAIAAEAQAKTAEQSAASGQSSGGNQSSSDLDNLPENISPLNPMFMKAVTGIESDRYWRSPRIKGIITSVAVGDLNGTGKNELVALMADSIRIYRLDGQHFQLVHQIKNGPKGQYLFADIADIDGDGMSELYITNLNVNTVESFVLTFSGKQLSYKIKDVNYYLRVQPNPVGEGHLLFGQRKGNQRPFKGSIYKMKWAGGEIVEEENAGLPKMATIFNFVLADLNGSGRAFTALLGPSYHLRVYNPAGEEIFMSADTYGGTSKYISVKDRHSEGADYIKWYLYSRLMLVDLNQDGRQELIVVKNEDRMGFMLANTRSIFQGTLLGLAWDGMSMSEEWRTPRMSGNLMDYTVGDVGNVGKPALVMCLVQGQLDFILNKNRSNVVAFTLKVMPKKDYENKGL